MLKDSNSFYCIEEKLRQNGTISRFENSYGKIIKRMMITLKENKGVLRNIDNDNNVIFFEGSFDFLNTSIIVGMNVKTKEIVYDLIFNKQEYDAESPNEELISFFIKTLSDNIRNDGTFEVPMYTFINDINNFTVVSVEPIISNDYQSLVEIGGKLELDYLKNGNYNVSYKEYGVDEPMIKYEVYYPLELENTNKKYPVIIYCNGTAVKGTDCVAMFKHWASWGFIVVGSEDENTGTGETSEKILDFLLNENINEKSIFYKKVDLDNVGITGHSQGAVGVFNAVTRYEHSHIYKTCVPISPVNEELSKSLNWEYDLSKVNASVFLLAGVGKMDSESLIPIDKMQEMYDKLNVSKLMARKKNIDHNLTDTDIDGYVTAWFRWQLHNDEYASKVFIGDNPEILSNRLYSNQHINLF